MSSGSLERSDVYHRVEVCKELGVCGFYYTVDSLQIMDSDAMVFKSREREFLEKEPLGREPLAVGRGSSLRGVLFANDGQCDNVILTGAHLLLSSSLHRR